MKRKEQIAEIAKMNESELKEKAGAVANELMRLRFRAASGQLEQGHRFKLLRRQLARLKTAQSSRVGASRSLATQSSSKQA